MEDGSGGIRAFAAVAAAVVVVVATTGFMVVIIITTNFIFFCSVPAAGAGPWRDMFFFIGSLV